MSVRLLLVEDDHRIRQLLTTTFVDEGFEVTDVATGEHAIGNPVVPEMDIAVVDLRLPGMDGIQVVRELRRHTRAPIVILTAHGESTDVVEGLEAGADDFLRKPIVGRELVARLRAILRRTSSPSPTESREPFTVGRLTISAALHEASVDGRPLHLTRTEFKVLHRLGSQSPETLTRQDLLETVWGYDYLGDSRLVDMQIYRLRQKLEELGLKENLLTIRGVGFRLVP